MIGEARECPVRRRAERRVTNGAIIFVKVLAQLDMAAPTIGISVDPRRQNLSEESLKANVERLKAYKDRLILFPRKGKSPKQGDASADDVKKAREAGHDGHVKQSSNFFPISNKFTVEEGKVGDYESEEAAYRKLRDARSEARHAGKRAKRQKEKEEEAANAKK